MKALLKRRWFLLSCATVLLGCSFFDLEHCVIMTDFHWLNGSGKTGQVVDRLWGLHRGELCYFQEGPYSTGEPHARHSEIRSAIHLPCLGGYPEFHVYGIDANPASTTRIIISLWLPLSVILGWLVICELRWRETARAPALPSNAGGEARRSRGIRGDNRARKAEQP